MEEGGREARGVRDKPRTQPASTQGAGVLHHECQVCKSFKKTDLAK